MTTSTAPVTTPLAGCAALITGASSGIGAATARHLAARGAQVALAARRTDRLVDLAEEIHTLTGRRPLTITTDVTDPLSARAAVEQTVDHCGRLDVLVNNAGVMLPSLVADANPADWRTMIEVNLLGVMYTTHAALPHLTRAADGERGVADLVIVSSVAGRIARPNNAAYNASKFGVNAFAEALRQEVAPAGIRVSVIEPGAVDTELTDHMSAQAAERVRHNNQHITPLGPDDVAEAITYVTTRPAHVAINEQLIRPARTPR